MYYLHVYSTTTIQLVDTYATATTIQDWFHISSVQTAVSSFSFTLNVTGKVPVNSSKL